MYQDVDDLINGLMTGQPTNRGLLAAAVANDPAILPAVLGALTGGNPMASMAAQLPSELVNRIGPEAQNLPQLTDGFGGEIAPNAIGSLQAGGFNRNMSPGDFYPSGGGTGSENPVDAAFMAGGGPGFGGPSNQLRPGLMEAQYTKRPGSRGPQNPFSRKYSRRPSLPRGTCRIKIIPPGPPGRMPRKTTKEGLWSHALADSETSFRTGGPENAPIEFDLSRYRRAFQAGCNKILDSAQKPGGVLFRAIHRSTRSRGEVVLGEPPGQAVIVNTRMSWQTDVSGVGDVNFSIVGTVLPEGNMWVFKGIIAPLPERFNFNKRPPGERKWYRERAAQAGRLGQDMSHVRPFMVFYVGSASVEARGRLPNR